MNKKAKLRKEADNLWFRYNLKPKCEVCGNKSQQVHHFFPKGQFGHLRYDNDNAISICNACHFAHHHKGDPTIHAKIIEKRGKEWFNKLKNKSRKSPSSYQTIGYYQEVINKLMGITLCRSCHNKTKIFVSNQYVKKS